MTQVAIIGSGTIGKELYRQLKEKGHHVQAVASSRSVTFYGPDGNQTGAAEVGTMAGVIRAIKDMTPDISAVMLAITNAGEGEPEVKYMKSFPGKHIVTCAKAAHAYRYDDVLDLGKTIGRRATVGGGTDLLEVLRRRHLQREELTIYAVVNGTLNFIMSEVQRGDSFMRALKAAQKLGYAEPNSDDPIEAVNGELMDVCMKASIIHNVALVNDGIFVTPSNFTIVPLQEHDINRLTSRNARYRFITTFTSVDDIDEIPEKTPGSLHAKWGRWRISGGFHDVRSESPWFDFLRQVDGVNNGFMVHNSFGEDTGNSLTGPGAGPVVTARAMVRDLHDLLAA